jgi:hypothetical protein
MDQKYKQDQLVSDSLASKSRLAQEERSYLSFQQDQIFSDSGITASDPELIMAQKKYDA